MAVRSALCSFDQGAKNVLGKTTRSNPTESRYEEKRCSWGGWGLGDIAINSWFIAVQDHVAQHYEAVRLGEGGMAV